MHAMVLKKLGTALEWTELPDRQPGPGEIRVKVAACGVCRTDLHVVDGELPDPRVPIIPGHEIVGRIDAIGAGVDGLGIGERVGIPWLGHTCGVCPYCVGRPGESVRPAAVHRLHARRRLRDCDDRRCALCLSARRGRQRRGARAFALRRPDRLAIAGDRRRGKNARPLRLRRRGPHRCAGRAMAGTIGLRLHAAGRCCHPGVRPAARRGMGGRIRRDAARAARRGDHLCDRSAISFRWR